MGPAPVSEEHGTCPTEYTKPEGKIHQSVPTAWGIRRRGKSSVYTLTTDFDVCPGKAGSQRKPCTRPWLGRGVINRNIVYNMCQHEHVVHTPTGAMNIQPTNFVVQPTNMCN